MRSPGPKRDAVRPRARRRARAARAPRRSSPGRSPRRGRRRRRRTSSPRSVRIMAGTRRVSGRARPAPAAPAARRRSSAAVTRAPSRRGAQSCRGPCDAASSGSTRTRTALSVARCSIADRAALAPAGDRAIARARAPGRRRGAPAPRRRARTSAAARRPATRRPRCACGQLRTHVCTARAQRVQARRTRRRRCGCRRACARPVDIMSMRARAGAVQALAQPGSARRAIQLLDELGRRRRLLLGPEKPEHALEPAPAPSCEYQRACATLGQSARGASRIVVSTIDNGAGSVAVLARPTLPNTAADLGERGESRDPAAQLVPRRSGVDARQRGRHEQQIALVDAGQELAAQART